jgi:hypothetical protein
MANRPDDRMEDDRRQQYQPPPKRGGYQRQGIAEAAAKSFIRSIASSIGRVLVRMITGRGR